VGRFLCRIGMHRWVRKRTLRVETGMRTLPEAEDDHALRHRRHRRRDWLGGFRLRRTRTAAAVAVLIERPTDPCGPG
jgi:hypothetical protein